MNSNIRLNDAIFCALDFETTGVNPVIDQIVEVGMVRFTMKEVLSTYSSFVNPKRDIPEAVIQIHGITSEMVKDAPLIMDVIGKITEFIGDSPLIIQNPRFDLAFLEVALKQCSKDVPPLHAYDTVRLSRKTFSNLPNYRLSTLCEHLNINIKYHRALSDAVGCMEIFRKIVSYHDRSKNWNFNDLDRIHGGALQPRLSKKAKQRLNINNKIFIGDVVKIRYMDNNGDITIRSILPKGLVKNGNKSYLYAYCYLRNDDRYFNTSRILRVF